MFPTFPLILQINTVSPAQTGPIRCNRSFQHMLHHTWWNWSHWIRLVAVRELAPDASVTLAGGVCGASPVRGDVRLREVERKKDFFLMKWVCCIHHIHCMYEDSKNKTMDSFYLLWYLQDCDIYVSSEVQMKLVLSCKIDVFLEWF